MMRRYLNRVRAIFMNLLMFGSSKCADAIFHIKGDAKLSLCRRLHLWLMDVRYGPVLRDGFSLFIKCRGNLVFGNRCGLSASAQFWNYGPIIIGDDFIPGPNLVVLTGSHEIETLFPKPGSVRIGSRVWCGANVTILPNVTIGDDAVIAAGAVVCTDVPPQTLYGGVPAKLMKRIERTEAWSWYDGLYHPVPPLPEPVSKSEV